MINKKYKLTLRNLLVLLLIFLYNCKSDKRDDVVACSYYPNGSINYKSIYLQGAKGDYDEYHYNDSGQLIYKQEIRDMKRDGKLLHYYNGNIEIIKSYFADSLHGVSKKYSKIFPNNQIIEYFTINGNKIIVKTFDYDSLGHSSFNAFFFNEPHKVIDEGHIIRDSNNNIIINNSHYYQVTSPDTILEGEIFDATISFIDKYDCDLLLKLGEMYRDLKFKEDPILYEGYKQIDFSISETHLGDNLIMGKLYASPDTSINEDSANYEQFIFYHEFYVKENKSWWDFW